MRLYDWVLSETPIATGAREGESMSSYHHMCTTRMSDDPAKGVVDRDCRVHGMRQPLHRRLERLRLAGLR